MSIGKELNLCSGFKDAVSVAYTASEGLPNGIGYSNCVDCGVIVLVENDNHGRWLSLMMI